MKRRAFLLMLSLLFAGLKAQPLNAVLGDSAWYLQHGTWPYGESDVQQIRNHLQFVHQRLLAKPWSHKDKRARMLSYLKDYIEEERFPTVFEYQGAGNRRPCFIDDEGTYCAVGYLMLRDGQEQLAQRINQEMRFAYLLEMEDEELLAWQEQSGLSLKELATIQPAYGFIDPPARKYQVYYSGWTEQYGLRRTKSKRPVLFPNWDHLIYPDHGNFIYGKRKGRWYAYNHRMSQLPKGGFWHDKAYDSLQLHRTEFEAVLAYFKNGRVGTIDSNGIEHPSLSYDSCAFTYRSPYLYLRKDSAWAFYDLKANKLHPGTYRSMQPIYDVNNKLLGMKVSKSDGVYIMGLDGELLSGPWADIDYFRGLYLATAQSGGRQTLVNLQGAILQDGLIEMLPVAGRFMSYSRTPEGFQLWDGYNQKLIVEDSFEDFVPFPSIQFKAKKEGKWGLLNGQGQVILGYDYSAIWHLYDAYLIKNDSGMGLADNRGNILIAPQFDSLGVLVQDAHYPARRLYFAQEGEQYRVFNQSAEELVDSIAFMNLQTINTSTTLLKSDTGSNRILKYLKGRISFQELDVDSIALVSGFVYRYQKEGKWGLWASFPHSPFVNRFFKGCLFDSIIPCETSDLRYFLVQENGLWGIYSFEKDSLVIPCQYDDFSPKLTESSPRWIYLRRQGRWDGFFPTTIKVQSLMPAAQAKLEKQWQASKGAN